MCRSGNGCPCADIYPVSGVHGTTAKDRTVSDPQMGSVNVRMLFRKYLEIPLSQFRNVL